MEKTMEQQGERILEQLKNILENANSFRDLAGDGTYQAFLHGQADGLALSLKILFPGDENLGEQATTLVTSVLGENKCGCHDHNLEEGAPGV